MKKLALCLMFAGILLGASSLVAGQQGASNGKPRAGDAPFQLCNAIERYVAKIDATRSIRDKAAREAKYAEAQQDLGPILKQYDMTYLLDAASSYAQFSEQATSADAADAAFPDIMDKKLKARSTLMNPCAPYTTER